MEPVLVTFVRGPLHLIQARMTWIPEVEVFTDPRDNTVYAYKREELVYYYDLALSAKLTLNYEGVRELFRNNTVDVTGEVKPKESIDSEE